MTHDHGHGGCGDHANEHDLPGNVLGYQDNLYNQIDRPHVVALNAVGQGQTVIKSWSERNDEALYLESDADDQLILRVPFTGSVKLRALLLKAGPSDKTPAKVSLFANENNINFDDIVDKTPTQEFDVPQGREVGEYQVRAAKFTNISSITVFFPASQGAEETRIYYLGFLGQWSERKADPIITVYEAQANPADHEKIQGMIGGAQLPQQ
ncbi:DUF1000-domain-containing protein [Thelephora terrestris]|uniref:DUF1000-domain-containing protein n=1 Tax=Thelephora terrestris TaxID=56493 RepID=A0A9P6HM58_9AGAM|nr:DUF1000-domain-containing protein [Thelephora terrestris]